MMLTLYLEEGEKVRETAVSISEKNLVSQVLFSDSLHLGGFNEGIRVRCNGLPKVILPWDRERGTGM